MGISQILHNSITRSINNQAHSFITIGEELNETINGNRFIALQMSQLATGTSFDIGIETPSTCDIRLTGIELGCDLNFAKCVLYENATFTGSTQLGIVNSNRQSTHLSDVKIYSEFSVAPNVTSATIIDIIATLGGTGLAATSIGGDDNGDGFFLLKKSTKYIARVSNEDGTTANILLKIPFIETDLTD